MILQDGETLKSHDLVVVLYTVKEEFYTNYMYGNDLTDEQVLEFVEMNHIDTTTLNILHIWRL